MNIIIGNEKYRVVSVKKDCYENIPCYMLSFKVQVKVFWFWITIKEFAEGEYDDNIEFCKNEAIELYNKIVNPYGTV